MTICSQSLNFRRFGSLLLAVALPLLSALVQAQSGPALFFSDLDSGPNIGGENSKGVYVTVWGNGFGATRGSGSVAVGGGLVENYPLWSDNKIIFQLGANAASGNIVVTNGAGAISNGVPFTVRAGRIFFVSPTGTGNGSATSTPMSPSAAYATIRPGDTFYFLAGTYSGNYGGNWGSRNFAFGPAQSGTAGNPVAFVGYPNAIATLISPDTAGGSNIITRSGVANSDVAHYMTFANLTMIGGSNCFATGGFWQNDEMGGTNGRLIGNTFSATYCSTCNTMTGLIVIEGDGWRVWGNEIKNTGTNPPINNNHGLYLQTGADNVDIGWNYFHDLRMGHVIQVHTDVAYVYENVKIHDNLITAANPSDSRGINVGLTSPGSYGSIYNNVLSNVGQNFAGIVMYTGAWKVFNNTLHNIYALPSSSSAAIWISGAGTTADVRNNIIHVGSGSQYIGAFGGASMSQMTLSNNLYYGNGSGPGQDGAAVNADPLFVTAAGLNFRLQSNSPAINRGSSAVSAVVAKDRDGGNRPYGAAFDIGAYEYGSSSSPTSLPAPQNLRAMP